MKSLPKPNKAEREMNEKAYLYQKMADSLYAMSIESRIARKK